MKICLSIAPDSTEGAISLLREYRRRFDLIELRLDAMSHPDVRAMLRSPRPPVIITLRSRQEGGNFSGSDEEAKGIYADALMHGAEYVDIEVQRGASFIAPLRKARGSAKFILSHHTPEGIPRNLSSIYSKARRLGADIVKIAYSASRFTDNAIAFDLYARARKDRQRVIAIAMGPYGEISRILPGIGNGEMTFGARDDGHQTAPGQLTADRLKDLFRVGRMNRSTRVFGLVGNPVSQSKGIFFHNERFRRRKLNAVYLNFLVDDLAEFFGRFMARLTGASITMPHKRGAIEYCDEVSVAAKEIGAVNTILRRRGKLIGSNGDFDAVVHLLQKRLVLRGKDAIVLGTGATATTMACAARSLGANVRVVGRNAQKAKELAGRFGILWGEPSQLGEQDCDILMNAIPNRQEGDRFFSPAVEMVPASFYRRNTVVFDAVYHPPITPLLEKAMSAGCRVISGLDLFTTQARLQSKKFVEAAR